MNIYIYGRESFKKQVSKILRLSDIESKLTDTGTITEVNTTNVLKKYILRNPKDIFLIDHTKIIVENFLTTKIDFLNPKDGIRKTFLEENGIGDVSIDEMSDISQHIIKKLEAIAKENNTQCRVEVKDKTEEKIKQPTQLNDISETDILDALSSIEKDN